MKTYPRACFLLFAAVFAAVPRPSDAFRSPAADMRTMTVNFDDIDSANYSGPVFVIKEMSDDDGRGAYEAFVLAGGIEEVQRPVSSTRAASRAGGAKKPSAAPINNGTSAPTSGGNKKKKPSAAAAVNNGTAAPSPGDNKKKPSAAAAVNNGTAAPSPGDGKKKPSAAAAVNNGTAVADRKKPPTAAVNNNGTSGDKRRPPAAAVNNGTAADREKPAVTVNNGTEVIEDPDYFGVLINHDSAAQIKLPGSLRVNVSLSVLLRVASSRMPWLLVLRRNSTVRLSVYRETTPAPSDTPRIRHRRPVDDGATAAEDPFVTGNADGYRGNGYDGGNSRLGSRSLLQSRRHVANATTKKRARRLSILDE